MEQWTWWLPILVIGGFWHWLAQARTNEQLQQRVLDLEIRLHKLQQHLGIVVDARLPMTDEVKIMAKSPGGKIGAIKLYRQQTGAGLKEAKDAVEKMMQS